MTRKLMLNNHSENGLSPTIYFNFCNINKYIYNNDGAPRSQYIDILSECENYKFIGSGTFNESRPASKVINNELILNGLDCRIMRLVNNDMTLEFNDINDITILLSYKRNFDNRDYRAGIALTNLGVFRYSTPTLFVFHDREKWTELKVDEIQYDKLQVGVITSTQFSAEYYNDGKLVTSTNNIRKKGAISRINLSDKLITNTSSYILYSLAIFDRKLSSSEISEISESEINKFKRGE